MRDDKDHLAALSISLDQATVSDCAATTSYRLRPDEGVVVEGMLTGRVGMHGNARIACILSLGEEPPVRQFEQALFKAVQATKE